jgi:TIR domain
MKNFAEEIFHFAQSVDFLTSDNVKAVKKLIIDHLMCRFRAATVEVCLETRIVGPHGNVGLYYSWFSGEQEPDQHNLFYPDEPKRYYGQTSFAFDRNLELWIIGKADVPLSRTQDYLNMMPDASPIEVPPFVPYAGNERIKTSIILPLVKRKKPRGILNIEIESRLNCSSALVAEAKNIRDAIGIIIEVGEVSKANCQNTGHAIDRLKGLATVRPKSYFISYSWDQSAAADHVEALLQRRGRNVLRDEGRVEAGAVIADEVEASIAECDVFLILNSKGWSESRWCRSEHQYALELRARGRHAPKVVVLELEDAKPPFLENAGLRLKGQTRDNRSESIAKLISTEEA